MVIELLMISLTDYGSKHLEKIILRCSDKPIISLSYTQEVLIILTDNFLIFIIIIKMYILTPSIYIGLHGIVVKVNFFFLCIVL